MERINILKRLSNSFHLECQLDFTDDRTLLINFLQKIDHFSPIFVDIIKEYLKFMSKDEMFECLLNSLVEFIRKNPQNINPSLINLFKWIYVDSYGRISENNLEFILKIINKFAIILLDILEKEVLELIDHICCYEIVDFLIQVMVVADSKVIFREIFINSLFSIFHQFSVSKNLGSVKIYNQFRLLKLLRISSMILKFHSLESYGEVIKKLVIDSNTIDFCTSTDLTGELCTISPLLKHMFIDIDISSKSTVSRKRFCLLMKLILIVLDWVADNIDDSHNQTLCSNILNVFNTNIGYLNTEFSIYKNWILLFLKDDSKLIKFLSYTRIVEEKGFLRFINLVELLDELFLDIDYDCGLLWQWFCEYEDLEMVFIHYFNNWNGTGRSVDCTNRIMAMFLQISDKFKEEHNQEKGDFEIVLENFIQMKKNFLK